MADPARVVQEGPVITAADLGDQAGQVDREDLAAVAAITVVDPEA
ncbi:hypothetical protein J23TS9_25750 [Paenibacillus sp. J23TS9]|nr:hypothetical protein J23TS9_25750 [Paenibacillus sp. J23TS9]